VLATLEEPVGNLGRMSVEDHIFVEWRGSAYGRSDSGSS